MSDPDTALEAIGTAALDALITTFNSRQPDAWAATLSYPHVRVAPRPGGQQRVLRDHRGRRALGHPGPLRRRLGPTYRPRRHALFPVVIDGDDARVAAASLLTFFGGVPGVQLTVEVP